MSMDLISWVLTQVMIYLYQIDAQWGVSILLSLKDFFFPGMLLG